MNFKGIKPMSDPFLVPFKERLEKEKPKVCAHALLRLTV